MRFVDPAHVDERSERHRIDGSEGEGVGPQGAALILELQRLRQAFEDENLHDRKAPPSRLPLLDGPQPQRPRSARPKRRRKGKMGRVLGAWLGPFGFQADGVDEPAAPPPRRSAPREPAFTSPPISGAEDRGPLRHSHPKARPARGRC